jgi:hypothetical protein
LLEGAERFQPRGPTAAHAGKSLGRNRQSRTAPRREGAG